MTPKCEAAWCSDGDYIEALLAVFEIVQARRARFAADRVVAQMVGIPRNAEEIQLDEAITRVEALRG